MSGEIFSGQLGAMFIGFIFILVASVSDKEKTQSALGLMGLLFIFWGLGFFGLGRVVKNMVPALTLMFGLFSFYTRDSAQMLCILVTIVLAAQIAFI